MVCLSLLMFLHLLKVLYGKGVHKSLTEVFNPELIDGIELGLSSDTNMADEIKELHTYTFLSNSDAHSLAKIAREYQAIAMKEPTFNELKKALTKEDGREIVANYGLDPLLGKYHQTVCENVSSRSILRKKNVKTVGTKRLLKGVADRI